MATRTIDLEKPLTYVFKDPNWAARLLMGGLLHLLAVVLVGAFISLGYQKRLFHALVENENAPLPELDVSQDLAEGAPVFGLLLCYWLPVFFVSSVPCFGQLLAAPLWLAVAAILPAALTRYYVTGRFGAAFEFDQLLAYTRLNLTNVLLCLLLGLIGGTATMLGCIACVLPLFFASFWASLVQTRALADTWRLSLEGPGQGSPSERAPTVPTGG